MPSSEAESESRHSRAESSVARRKSGRRTKAVFGAADPSHLWSIFSLAESIYALVLADSRPPPFQGVPEGTLEWAQLVSGLFPTVIAMVNERIFVYRYRHPLRRKESRLDRTKD